MTAEQPRFAPAAEASKPCTKPVLQVVAGTHPAHSFFPFDSDTVTPVTEGKCRPD
jgi:hypothetical protein